MPAGFEWDKFGSLDAALGALANIDCTPLCDQWEQFIFEGNRRGVLSGLDGYNRPAPAVQYRFGIGKKTWNRKAGGHGYGESIYESTGAGPYASGLHDNLTRAQYQQLTGPRLAPRGDRSRIIKNLHVETRHEPGSPVWEVVGAWYDVVSVEGVPFLVYHFNGEGHNPVYDLRPVRPEDLQFSENALRAFVQNEYISRF